MSIKRSQVIQLMSGAFKRGQSASAFISDMRAKGLSYRRTDMLSDWRSVNELEAKKGLVRFVRKDRFPARQAVAEVEWKLSQEFMYKVRVESRLRPDAPVNVRFVNIMSDTPMTPSQVEQATIEKWAEWENYTGENLTNLTVWSAIHKTIQ